MAFGLWWASGHLGPEGWDLNDIPLAQAAWSFGFVVILLQYSPSWQELPGRLRKWDKLVTLSNNRAVTIYLWHNLLIMATVPIIDLAYDLPFMQDEQRVRRARRHVHAVDVGPGVAVDRADDCGCGLAGGSGGEAEAEAVAEWGRRDEAAGCAAGRRAGWIAPGLKIGASSRARWWSHSLSGERAALRIAATEKAPFMCRYARRPVNMPLASAMPRG